MPSSRLASLLGLGVLALALAFIAPAVAPTAAGPSHEHAAIAPSEGAVAFEQQMRALWEDHITWTRLYIISVAADLPDQEVTAQRLLRNQDDIGDALKPYYGEDAGNTLTALLRDHILGAAELLAAAKTGDQARLDAASASWYANADQIATFLNTANPDHWPLADTRAEMKMHLDLTLKEATARLSGDWPADVAAYDEVHHHILGWADVISTGVIAQFPERFT